MILHKFVPGPHANTGGRAVDVGQQAGRRVQAAALVVSIASVMDLRGPPPVTLAKLGFAVQWNGKPG
jgi:hypothetical protein